MLGELTKAKSRLDLPPEHTKDLKEFFFSEFESLIASGAVDTVVLDSILIEYAEIMTPIQIVNLKKVLRI